MDYKYSIIIPHHNSAVLLERMLHTIPERNDIQIIVVDDGSKPDEVIKLKNINHCNLEIYYLSENHGAGYARNIGLKKIKGEWTLVVDADDKFANDTFMVFDNNISEDIDLICFCAKCYDASTGEISKYKDMSDESVRLYIKKNTQYSLNRFRYRNTVCWNKLVRTEFLQTNHIEFEDCEVNNDVFYALQIGHKIKRFKAIPDELYQYMINDGSITHKKRSIEREFLFYLMVQKRNGLYKELGLMRYPFYRHTYLYIPHLTLKRGFLGMVNFFKYLHRHKDDINKARKEYLKIL